MSFLPNKALGLPEIHRFKQRSDVRNGWSDHYGALKVGLAYAGLREHDGYFHAIWQHGCQPPWRVHSPKLLAYNSPAIAELPILVARADQAELLHNAGYPNARAIGIPIVYVPSPKRTRRSGSLLVFPTHTLDHEAFPDRSPFEQYAAEVKAYSRHFKEVVVCIHPSCIKNGLWVKEFAAIGIPMIQGASIDDRNALLRMRSLFERFETLTTNGWGSHVAYGLAFGCKVSIAGSKPERTAEHYLQDDTWALDKEALRIALSDEAHQAERVYLRKLYAPPTEAVGDIEWGRVMIGTTNRLSHSDMRDLLRQTFRSPIPRSMLGWIKGLRSVY